MSCLAIALHIVEGPIHDDGEFVEEGRLEACKTILAHADELRSDRLMRTALRSERHAGRRADDHETGILIAGIVQGIETAGDEGIVDGADRQQSLSEQRMGQASRTEQQEEVHFSDAEFEMLAGRPELPLLRRRDAFVAERIGELLACEQATAIDPWPEIGRDGDIGRGRDDACRKGVVTLGKGVEDLAEAGLRRQFAVFEENRAGGGKRGRSEASSALGKERHGRNEAAHLVWRSNRAESLPFFALADADALLEGLHLRLGHQAGMVVLVPGKRRTPALDRIGQEDRRPVVIDAPEGVDQRLQAMAAEVVHEIRELLVAAGRKKIANTRFPADFLGQPLAPGTAALEGQRGIELVRTPVNPVAQCLAARLAKSSLLKRTVFQHLHIPAEGSEYLFDALPQSFANDAVKALPVIVDHPPGVAQIVFPTLLQAFVDIALVKLGVADQRDHASDRTGLRPRFCGDVVLND